MENIKEKEKLHGKKIAENAEKVWGWASPAGQLRAERRAETIVDFINKKVGLNGNILEIGCGTGVFSEKFRKKIPDLICADISFELIAKQPKTKTKNLVADIENLCFKADSFDAVIGSSILHHLNIDKVLSIIYKSLKRNGCIVFAEPNMLNPQIAVQKNIPFIKKWLGDTPDETAFVRFSLEKKMRKSGYKNIKIIPYDFLHPSLPKVFIPFFLKIQKYLEKTFLIKEIAGSLFIYAEK